jgi:hypothetical protein
MHGIAQRPPIHVVAAEQCSPAQSTTDEQNGDDAAAWYANAAEATAIAAPVARLVAAVFAETSVAAVVLVAHSAKYVAAVAVIAAES